MPESSAVKYYPIIARILLLLGGLPLVTFRASIVASENAEVATDYRMIHRFIMEYKGYSESCSERREEDCRMYRRKAEVYLAMKVGKAKRFEGKTLEPMVEIEIDLRGVTPTLAIAQEAQSR